jgi:hypothetical protein
MDEIRIRDWNKDSTLLHEVLKSECKVSLL